MLRLGESKEAGSGMEVALAADERQVKGEGSRGSGKRKLCRDWRVVIGNRKVKRRQAGRIRWGRGWASSECDE